MSVQTRSPFISSRPSCFSFCRLLVMGAGASLTMAVSQHSLAQATSDQAETLSGIKGVRVTVASVMAEALDAGLRRDSLAREVQSILRDRSVPVGEGKGAELRIDVTGFKFGSRLSFSVKMALWQTALLVASGDTAFVETWSDLRDSEAEGPAAFMEECRRLVQSEAEAFSEDFQRVNVKP
jgi:hypothetical protein